MASNRLLKAELEDYSNNGIDMKAINYTKNVFIDLFDKYNDYGMCEHSYCCHGLEHSCWVEVVEEGNWNLTLEKVKRNILTNIKESTKYLYNTKKYSTEKH